MDTENRRLKICILGHKRIPSREGGIEVVVEELATRMAEKGHKVVCLNRSGHHVSGKEFHIRVKKEYKGVRIRNVLTLNIKGMAAMTASFSGALCAAVGRFDVVHFHAEGSCAMMWIPKLMGKRCIATVHGLDYKCPKWGKFAKKYIKFGEKMAVKWADEIIVLSPGIQKYFLDEYGRETVLIPNGVEKAHIREAYIMKEKFGLEKQGYILFLGRVVPGKGLEYLIHAFKKVKTDKKLVIAGGASDSEGYMKALIKLASEDERIIFTDFVQGSLWEELYSNAYFFVLPSDLEGMPMCLLEAMSYGNCCLVSDLPECIGVVEDHGISFKKGIVMIFT